jgi:alginate O-acetyltransferase complex protein AlgI
VLLLSGLAFFALGTWWHAVVAAGLGVVTHALARWMASRPEENRGLPLLVGVLVMVGAFVGFRYGAPAAARAWGAAEGVMATLVPVGLSFIMFENVAFLADVYLGRTDPMKSVWDHVQFNLFFPTRVIGPMRRQQDFTAQLENAARPTPDDVAEGLRRLGLGVLKKVVLANPLGSAVGFLFMDANVARSGPLLLLAGACTYWLFLFLDFSGYTDMVVGHSRLMGLKVPENFQRPYTAVNINEYWQRWHMSLSGWVRDYVFNPLAIRWRNHPQWGAPVASFISMVVLGIWHGLEWRYVLFGAWHGLLLGVAMVFRERTRKTPLGKTLAKARSWKVAGWVFVMANAVLSHVFYAAPNTDSALRWYARLFTSLGGA